MGNAVYSSSSTRVFACSDLHVDHKTNWDYLKETITTEKFTERDVLVVAGDISSSLPLVKQTFEFLTQIFKYVFFCPGNNELRHCKTDRKAGLEFESSVEKFHYIIKMCEELGVHTKPVKANGDIWIVPLFAWYTPEFDKKWDGEFVYRKQWLDFRACTWQEDLKAEPGGISEYFLSLNKERLEADYGDTPVITFSHFLPRFELLPSRILLIHKSTTLICGDRRLDTQIRQIGAKVHIFGHTHIDQDMVIKGIRYVQNAFGHPNERKQPWNILKGAYEPKLVYTVEADATTSPSSEGGGEKEDEEFVEKADSDDELEIHEVEVPEPKKPRKKKKKDNKEKEEGEDKKRKRTQAE